MNKIHRLERTLTHLRSLNIFRVNSTRCFSTGKDSEGGINDSSISESVVDKKETQAETKENTETTTGPEKKLSGFAQSYEKFSHINDKVPETPKTFASLIRNSKFVDVNIPCVLLHEIYLFFK